MRRDHYDAIVVGSGVNGGAAALELTRAGLQVLVIEAGSVPKGNPYGTPVSNLARRLAQRWLSKNQQIQERHAAYWELNPELFINDKTNPYTTPEEMPYRWIRGRQFGGKSHTWGGCTLRLSDYEFKSASRDGVGSDWPLSTADLAPYYDRLERFFRVHGNCDGLKQLPDGSFLKPHALSPGERFLRSTLSKDFGRALVISRGICASRQREVGKQYSQLSSPGTSLAVAAQTNRLTIETDAIVCRIFKSPCESTVNCVEYMNAQTRRLSRVHGAVIFLCASTIESLRILMLSDLGNRSGLLGKGLMDNIVCNVMFHLPDIPDAKGYALTGGDSILIPRYQNLTGSGTSFHRGFGFWGGIQRLWASTIIRKQPGIALGFLCGMGETLRDDTNEVRLDPLVRDEWGIPVPRISCKWTANDLKLSEAIRTDAEQMIQAVGGELTSIPEAVWTPLLTQFMSALHKDWELTTPGQFVHEVGGARMGTVREQSVVNPYCQLWESPNVFVTDGACWPTSSWQNPTLTEMAITARATDRAIAELKMGNL